jgi:hypothetical protein
MEHALAAPLIESTHKALKNVNVSKGTLKEQEDALKYQPLQYLQQILTTEPLYLQLLIKQHLQLSM